MKCDFVEVDFAGSVITAEERMATIKWTCGDYF
jgi:hypothetical protein